MMNKIHKYSKEAAVLLAIFYLVGLAGFSSEKFRPYFISLVAVNLILNLVVLMLFHQGPRKSLVSAGLIIYFAGLLVEMAGVNTGVIFGDYTYGPVLGPAIFHTPLMIGVNWFMLVYAIWLSLKPINWPEPVKMLVGSAAMVAYDIFLEPVAIWTNMWRWQDGLPPVKNYLAWFVISFVMFVVAGKFLSNARNKIALALFSIQLLFFIALNLINSLL